MEHTGFLYFDLQSLTQGKPFSGFATGTYVDMLGRKITIKATDLKAFIKNTMKLIADFQGKGHPGLPIDARQHDKGDAAGWITSAVKGEATDSEGKTFPVIQFMAEWTEIGVDLISKKIQANFSPTVDLKGKVVRGGTLTNWPATVDDNGVPIFEAIELSQGIAGLKQVINTNDSLSLDNTGEGETSPTPEPNEVNMSELAEMKAQHDALATQVSELATAITGLVEIATTPPDSNGVVSEEIEGSHKEIAELERQRYIAQLDTVRREERMKVEAEIAREHKEVEVIELSQQVTGGTGEHPHGIPVNAKDLKEFLLRLEQVDYDFAKKLLVSIQANGLTDFSELGHGRQVKHLQPVPKEYAVQLQAALDNGHTAQEYFDTAELGNADNYDLSSFKEGK